MRSHGCAAGRKVGLPDKWLSPAPAPRRIRPLKTSHHRNHGAAPPPTVVTPAERAVHRGASPFSGQVSSAEANVSEEAIHKLVAPAQQLPHLPSLGQCLLAVQPVLPLRHAAGRQPLRRPRPGALAAVQPTTAVRHPGRRAPRPAPRPRATTRRRARVAGWIPILEPAAPLCRGFFHSLLAHSRPPLPCGADTAPTTAWPPECTWTCSTVTFCWPLPR